MWKWKKDMHDMCTHTACKSGVRGRNRRDGTSYATFKRITPIQKLFGEMNSVVYFTKQIIIVTEIY